jgi:ATP-dependent phosphoenolpyruvate carboxykinase
MTIQIQTRASFQTSPRIHRLPKVSEELFVPRNTWVDKSAYDAAARKLSNLFHNNFKAYPSEMSIDIRKDRASV